MIQPAFSFPSREELKAKATELHLASDPYWHRLLHYRRNLLGRYQSEIDDPTFFNSPAGRRHPDAELQATIDAFFAPSPQDPEAQHAACRFSARLDWLEKRIGLDPRSLPVHSCERFESWRAKLAPESAALIFASSYMNNPSSMYGHTFLLLKKQKNGVNELLDYVVNFAADLEGDNGILFAIKGLAGGYHGRFSTFPYYMKVQEYAHLESRDLWEYDLSLSSAQVKTLVQHLWELGGTRLPYYFLNKNCSYYLLSVLEVADPNHYYKKPFVFKAIPVDTVRAVNRNVEGHGSIAYRPSHSHVMLHRRLRLTHPEIRMAEELAQETTAMTTPAFKALAADRQSLILESTHDLFRYRVGFSRDQSAKNKSHEHALLSARSQLPSTAHAVNVPPPGIPPQEGHATGRFMYSHGFSNRSQFEELSLRSAIHDQEDPPQGYLPGSKLEMFHLKLRYDHAIDQLYVREFSVIDMLSMTPYDRWIHPPSWKVQSGLSVADDLPRDPNHALYYGLNLGSGYSAWLLQEGKVLLYGLAEMTLQLGSVFDDDVRFGGGPSAGVLVTPVPYWRMRFSGSYFPYASGGTPSTNRLALYQSVSFTKNFDVRLKLERANHYKEILLSLVYFL
jgi:hypothetical protein